MALGSLGSVLAEEGGLLHVVLFFWGCGSRPRSRRALGLGPITVVSSILSHCHDLPISAMCFSQGGRQNRGPTVLRVFDGPICGVELRPPPC